MHPTAQTLLDEKDLNAVFKHHTLINKINSKTKTQTGAYANKNKSTRQQYVLSAGAPEYAPSSSAYGGGPVVYVGPDRRAWGGASPWQMQGGQSGASPNAPALLPMPQFAPYQGAHPTNPANQRRHEKQPQQQGKGAGGPDKQ
jgi:hypothetical protein